MQSATSLEEVGMTMEREGRFGVLIVDDEPNIRSGFAKGLATEADLVDTAGSAIEALEKFQTHEHALVIVDVRLNCEMTGLELLRRIIHLRPQTAVIVITAHGTVETAVEAMRSGAFDFILKPVDLNLVRQQVRKARLHFDLLTENALLRHQLAESGEISRIVAGGAAMEEVFRQIRQVAAAEATVMIHGESGTGKELIARALHDLSDRSNGPFIAVNLGALPETLLESELFGHEKGAFSGAIRQKPGCFEQATGGTLFLDEVTEMSPKSQVDLLRVLETGEFNRIGGESRLQSDARIISATNRSVQDLIDEGTFREDLFYRLNIIPIEVPPLRRRREDIPLLVQHFLEHFCSRHRKDLKSISTDAMQILTSSPWPGNVRQLRNVIERMVIVGASNMIDVPDLPTDLRRASRPNPTQPTSLAEALDECEKVTIQAALEACHMHREHTAKLLGISVRTLHYKMSRHGMH